MSNEADGKYGGPVDDAVTRRRQRGELFDVSFKKMGHSAQIDDAVINLTEQTVSLREKTSARTSWVDGGVERLERE